MLAMPRLNLFYFFNGPEEFQTVCLRQVVFIQVSLATLSFAHVRAHTHTAETHTQRENTRTHTHT